MIQLWPMIPADDGAAEIGRLADAWAAMAVRDVLEPNAEDILRAYCRQGGTAQPTAEAGTNYPPASAASSGQ
jgi:hypothetical protein